MKAIKQISKVTEDISKSRQKKSNFFRLLFFVSFFCLLLVMSSVNFDVCSIAFLMYLLNVVPFSISVLIHDYSTPLCLDGFPNATILLSLSFELFFCCDVVNYYSTMHVYI